MNYPASPYFTPIPLTDVFNTRRTKLPEELSPQDGTPGYGDQQHLGIPFALGQEQAPNVILLDRDEVTVPVGGRLGTYLLVLHVVEDRVTVYQEGLADSDMTGRDLGDHVSDYLIEYADGSSVSTAIHRRFAIQQGSIGWGSSAFAAVPLSAPGIVPLNTEAFSIGMMPPEAWGRAETRHRSGRDMAGKHVWVYALPNPRPGQGIDKLTLKPRSEKSAVYAVSITALEDHPLRPGVRRKLRLSLPAAVRLNAIGEAEGLHIDLGAVITSRAVLDYDADRWTSDDPTVQPKQSLREVVVEYSAHPMARLYVPKSDDDFDTYDLATLCEESHSESILPIPPSLKPVKVIVREKGTALPVSVRLHMHGSAGEYLPPRGHHRKVNPYWFEDNYGEFVDGHNQYAYIGGQCIVDLPLGPVYVEITRGYEVKPLRTRVDVGTDTDELVFDLERVLRWREKGWVTADTHVHFLSPQTALLEGQAEGVNVVNLLASQWGEMFSNVGDFDGKTTLGARDFGGDGEFLVRVGTENRMQVLGHMSLLGYSGEMIHPLCTGGPSESPIGDTQEVTMSQWARRCRDQNGLVVMPHAPDPQLERAADIVLGLVDGIEMMTFNPMQVRQIAPYGLADWYRYLNLGYQLPVVGGSDKMSASSLLGGVRTYANLGDDELTYEAWMAAVRRGDTFVTVGPLVTMEVEGVRPGGQISLPAGGGTVSVQWKVESANLPVEQVEVVVGSLVVEQVSGKGELSLAGETGIRVDRSTWVAVRVRGSYRQIEGEIAAHTSCVQLLVADEPIYSETDAGLVLDQIEGALAYVDTLAPRPEERRYRLLRAELESAYNRLHQRMHSHGVFHRHTPFHDHESSHEH